jgi:hypothetical protein
VREAKRGVSSNSPLAKDDLVDAPRRYTDRASEGVLTDPHGGQKFFQQDFTGMDVGQFAHRRVDSMIVDDFDGTTIFGPTTRKISRASDTPHWVTAE